jgi:hypothetical protein
MATLKKYNAIIVHSAFLYLILFFFFPPFSIAQNITTIAGTGVAGYNGDGIAATAAQINLPNGLAIDAAGNLYIGELVSQRIRKIDVITGLISTIAGTGTGGYNGDGILAVNAQINNPTALVFDANGDLFFSDRFNHRVRKITMSTGIISTVAGTGTNGYNGDGIAAAVAQINYPNNVSFDANGDLFIADWQNYRVRKVDINTGIISTIAGTGVSGYNGDGIAATTAQLGGPAAIIFDNAGNTFISDFYGARIRKITKNTGLISTIAGTGTLGYNGDGIAATSAMLSGNWGIRFDAAENMYVADANNQRIRKITKSTGLISTIAGTGTNGYNGDGIPATTAEINYPYNIYFDLLNCNLYIADHVNHRIRKVTGGFAGCPSPVAPGNLVSCQVLPAVAINNANKNSWVPVFDSSGNIAVMINANGNILGTVNTSLYTKTGPCREDGNYRLYLNRNITITPQFQPASGYVSVRLYILKAELDSLKTAVNSQNQPSGVASINEVDVFKNNDACITLGGNTALPLTAATGSYNSDYYLQINVSGFSSFYFANKLLPAILPVKISSFTGESNRAINILKWKATCNAAVIFNIERSSDGIFFQNIGNLNATAADCNQPFIFNDLTPGINKNFYRLKITEAGGVVNYSKVILLQNNKSGTLSLTVISGTVNTDVVNVQINSNSNQHILLTITDIMGRNIFKKEVNVPEGNSTESITPGRLSSGIYWLYGKGNEGRSNIVKFIKQ